MRFRNYTREHPRYVKNAHEHILVHDQIHEKLEAFFIANITFLQAIGITMPAFIADIGKMNSTPGSRQW